MTCENADVYVKVWLWMTSRDSRIRFLYVGWMLMKGFLRENHQWHDFLTLDGYV